MAKITKSYFLCPESVLKLKLLSAALKTSQSTLLDLLIDDLWNQKAEEVTTTVTSQRVTKEAKRIIERYKVR